MVKLIIVRHCQAQGNLERFFQGRIDTDVTETGRAQVGAVAKTLAAEPFDVMYTTTLRRARYTADGINLYHDVPVMIDDRLIEIDAGLWEGRYLTDIEKEFPEEFCNWRNCPERFAAPGGESMRQVYDRVSEALSDIARENDGKTVCIVSHGCAIKNMMCRLHGKGFSHIGEIPIGTNTAINVVTIDGDDVSFITECDTDHLELLK